jgi:glyoxylase-like metal-dependent hydrolase (beta-lactamase superfamily II)
MKKAILAGLAMVLAGPAVAQAPAVKLWRLDCGKLLIKNFNSFFSDTLEYAPGAREVEGSCYLVQSGDNYLLWDAGYPASFKGKPVDQQYLVVTVTKTIAEQLAELKLAPADIDILGISHMHADHIGQSAEFPGAKLLIGKADLEMTKGKDDPFATWRSPDAKVQTMHGLDIDVFGDGKVFALNLPGHTPDHMALLVKLASGNVLLSGDLYHSTEAREHQYMPPFNSSRAETLASMDRFERLAKKLNAKVVIQHEPADVAKLPAFPTAAE